MMRSIRARLFLTTGVVVAVAIALSGLLSRRATLVEVRQIAERPQSIDLDALRALGTQTDAVFASTGPVPSPSLDAIVAASAAETRRAVLVIDMERTILAASDKRIAAGRVLAATASGDLSLEFRVDGQSSTLELRRAPVHIFRLVAGAPAAFVFLLPPELPSRGRGPGAPPWMLATASIAAVALALTFALSRRILGPVSALRAAAERMTGGDLDARVEVRGSDELADLSSAFNAMAGRLAETEALRRQMVSDVAHELRSPVTNLRCTLEAIQDGLVEADRRSVDGLYEETLFLQRMIADLEDLARADAGGLVLRRDRVDLAEVVRRAAATAGALGSGGPIAVVDGSAPVEIVGDRDRLEQVFRNLLANARTHTTVDGHIAVSIRSENASAIVEVRDDGRGIGADDLPHVFDRFYRADRSRTRATGGAGLGLAIARQLVLAHGGSIAAESDGPGRGATFTVRLPRATADQELAQMM